MTDATNATSTPFHIIDVENWPTVVLRVVRPPLPDADEVQTFFGRFISLLELARDGNADGTIAPTKLFVHMNIDGIVAATASQIWQAAGFIKQVKPLVDSSIHATALVVTTLVARTVLQAIISFQPLSSEHKIFASDTEAAAWLASLTR